MLRAVEREGRRGKASWNVGELTISSAALAAPGLASLTYKRHGLGKWYVCCASSPGMNTFSSCCDKWLGEASSTALAMSFSATTWKSWIRYLCVGRRLARL